MRVGDKERLKNLTTEEQELREIVIDECCAALVPFAFSSFCYSILRKLKRK